MNYIIMLPDVTNRVCSGNLALFTIGGCTVLLAGVDTERHIRRGKSRLSLPRSALPNCAAFVDLRVHNEVEVIGPLWFVFTAYCIVSARSRRSSGVGYPLYVAQLNLSGRVNKELHAH